MSSNDRNVCNKCLGVRRPSEVFEFETDRNISPLGTGNSPVISRARASDSDLCGLRGDGDTLRVSSLSSSNDSLWRNANPKAYEEYLNHYVGKQDDLTSKTLMKPTRSQSNCIISVILMFVTVGVVLAAMTFLWHTKEIAILENAVIELQKELKISEKHTTISLNLMESNIKFIVERSMNWRIQNLGNQDCEAIAANCAWDICMGGFPSLLNKLYRQPPSQYYDLGEIDASQPDFGIGDASLKTEDDDDNEEEIETIPEDFTNSPVPANDRVVI